MQKILVPLDGSSIADRTLVQTRPLLARPGTEVRLLRVLTDEALAAAKSRGEDAVAKTREHLDRLRDLHSPQGVAITEEVAQGEPAETILLAAADYVPDLIVVSTHGKAASLRWVRGSVAERVLRRAEHPVLFVNPLGGTGSGESRELKLRRILVPVDGSESSGKILPLAADLARAWSAQLLLLHVVEATPSERPEPAPPAIFAPYLAKLEGLTVRTLLTQGSPAASILDTAEEEGVDAVAMTTHGRATDSHWTFGSVAEQVLRHWRGALLVVRTSGFEGEGLIGRKRAPASR